MIPKIIHQIWFGKNKPSIYMNKWKNLNPNWEYRLWTDRNMFPLINQKHFDSISTFNGKSDIVRYEILYNNGGFYVDADTIPLLPLDDFFVEDDLFSCYESERLRPGLIASSFLGASKNNEFIKLVIDELNGMPPIQTKRPDDSWITVGPKYFTEMVNKHQPKIKIHPSHFFNPAHFASGDVYQGPGKVYCDHYFGTTKGRYSEQMAFL